MQTKHSADNFAEEILLDEVLAKVRKVFTQDASVCDELCQLLTAGYRFLEQFYFQIGIFLIFLIELCLKFCNVNKHFIFT